MATEAGLADFKRSPNERLDQRPHRLGADTEEGPASPGELLNAPSMVYSRSKSSDMVAEVHR